MSQSPKSRAKLLREPPPSLFLGPPSQNASHVSLVPVPPPNPSNLSAARAPLVRQRSQRTSPLVVTLDGPQESAVGPSLQRPAPRQQQDSEVKKQADRTDALWAEMQSTLEEVELSATNATHVFGPEHSKALEDLRAAQIGLAKAWARSEADDVVESTDKELKGMGSKAVGGGMLGSEGRSVLDTLGTEGGRGSTIASGSARPGSSGNGPGLEGMGGKLGDETDADILLAMRRREANDRYFQRVNGVVLDVVAKLEVVATAMMHVEQESRDIWGESESDATSFHA